MPRKRKAIPTKTQLDVLTQSGWRCAVPTCRSILALDIHHLQQVSEDGGDNQSNLIALCPTCHALFHRGDLTKDALYTYKAILESLSNSFDATTIDQLLFLDSIADKPLQLQGQGVLTFMRLIASGLADFTKTGKDMGVEFYSASLTDKGTLLVKVWKSGNRKQLKEVLGSIET